MVIPKAVFVVIQILAVLLAISIHESAHAWMADRCGDPTARYQGRITLNPIAHIDPIGTILFPLILAITGAPVFGWAKPVMVNPFNFRHPRRDGMLVSAAGPISNIITATIGTGLFVLLRKMDIVNLISGGRLPVLSYLLLYIIIINVFLAVFNLIPVPPLDGSGILEGVLRGQAHEQYLKLKPFGFLILIGIIYTGVLNIIADPIIGAITRILL